MLEVHQICLIRLKSRSNDASEAYSRVAMHARNGAQVPSLCFFPMRTAEGLVEHLHYSA